MDPQQAIPSLPLVRMSLHPALVILQILLNCSLSSSLLSEGHLLYPQKQKSEGLFYLLIQLLVDSEIRQWCWLMPQSKLFYSVNCGNNTSTWWTSVSCETCHTPAQTIFLPEAGSSQAWHKPRAQHMTRQVCVSNPQDKKNLLWTQDTIINSHKPREALQHTQRWNISQIKWFQLLVFFTQLH